MNKTYGMVSFILFVLGLAIAVIGGFVAPVNAFAPAALVIFGIIIGIVHIKDEEITTLLLATVALALMPEAFKDILGIGPAVAAIQKNIVILVAPVALIAAGKALLKVGLQK